MAALFVGAVLPGAQMPGAVSDKTLHYAAYAVLGVGVLRALAGGLPARIPWRIALLTILISSVHGAAFEVLQSATPSRQGDVMDLIADAIGAASAVVLCSLWGILSIPKPQLPTPKF